MAYAEDAVTADRAPIVCGIDFSPSSDHALQCAASIASRLDRPLHLVTAIEPLLAEAAKVRHNSDAFLQQVQRELEAQGARVSLSAGAIHTHVEAGEPAHVLLQAADGVQAAFVVMGTRGLGRAARFFLGSTAMRVLRSTVKPVLVVPEPERAASKAPEGWPAINRIVCGVDFSDGSIAAARQAVEWSRLLDARLTLVHALQPAAVPVIWEELLKRADAERASETRTSLDELAQSLGGSPEVVVKAGGAVEVLQEVAGDDAAAVLVVGLRGASYHRPGSTALQILSTSPVAVLAVPDNGHR